MDAFKPSYLENGLCSCATFAHFLLRRGGTDDLDLGSGVIGVILRRGILGLYRDNGEKWRLLRGLGFSMWCCRLKCQGVIVRAPAKMRLSDQSS